EASPDDAGELDLVVDTTRPAPDELIENPLARALTAAGIETHVIGDASPEGYLQGAMHGAHRVATAL
ncbi:MAG: hypothetical protein JWL72_3966, partial [Ilumatobacteraceae bacterium]|nr:hypothetical protein [Ilumatobacteraceae bacterium]